MLSTHKHIGHKVSEVSAAFAGSGYGLCEHYDDVDACENEEGDLPVSHNLAVTLSQTSFSTAYTCIHSAYRSILEKEITRLDLGLRDSSSNVKESEEEKEVHWSSIRATIIEVGRASRGRLTTLILLGENVGDPDFIKNVQDALRELLSGASPQEVSTLFLSGKRNGEIESLYLAARGAAEFAKRAQETPAGCKGPAHCAGNRVPPVQIPSNQILLSKERQRVEIEL
ncbi:MAG: hypothetical protein Q9190_002566 [Brigantiaea leucoxantha]